MAIHLHETIAIIAQCTLHNCTYLMEREMVNTTQGQDMRSLIFCHQHARVEKSGAFL